MPILDHTARGRLIRNVAYLCEIRHVPMSLLASKMMVDPDALERWLDPDDGGRLILSEDQFDHLADALGVQSRSNLYSYKPEAFQARYTAAGDTKTGQGVPKAETPRKPRKTKAAGAGPKDSKPGPKRPCHRKPKAVPTPACIPDLKPPPPSLQFPLTITQSSMTDAEMRMREHIVSLIRNPFLPLRTSIPIIYELMLNCP